MSVYEPSALSPAQKMGRHGNDGIQCGADRLVVEAIGSQLAHFENIDPPCRGLELPDGIEREVRSSGAPVIVMPARQDHSSAKKFGSRAPVSYKPRRRRFASGR